MVEHTPSQAQTIVERDSAVLSPSYTREYPFVMSHGSGAKVWDVAGREYIDFMAGIAVANTGHSHPDVIKAIKDQVDKFLHICLSDFYYENAVSLAETLSRIAPFSGDARVFFTNSGTETMEAAIKLARYATGRQHFLAFYGGFHGRTMGALSLTASKATQRAAFSPLMPGVTHVPYPYAYRPELAWDGEQDYGEVVVAHIEREVFKRTVPPGKIAAIVVEALQGEGGYIVPPAGFLPGLRRLCDEHGILLIVDEIQSGLGRTGKWWAVEHFGVEPDVVTTAKGIASGLPLGALIAKKELMDWEPGSHGSTFGGNPVSIAAAIETLRLTEEGLMDNAAKMGAIIMTRLNEMYGKYDIIGDVRGLGLMVGAEIITDRDSKTPSPEIRDALLHRLFEKGVLMFGCGVSTLRMMPALIIDEAITERALTLLDETFAEIQTEHGK